MTYDVIIPIYPHTKGQALSVNLVCFHNDLGQMCMHLRFYPEQFGNCQIITVANADCFIKAHTNLELKQCIASYLHYKNIRMLLMNVHDAYAPYIRTFFGDTSLLFEHHITTTNDSRMTLTAINTRTFINNTLTESHPFLRPNKIINSIPASSSSPVNAITNA